MLFERWQEIARIRSKEMAVDDLGAGRSWTFGELAAVLEGEKRISGGPAFPQGRSGEFVLDVLRSWRDGRIVCPLETGQTPIEWNGTLPEGIVHMKTTSATTGAAHLVAFTASQLMADADNIVGTMGLRPDWPNLGLVSLAHSYGFSNLILPLLLHGIPLILADSTLPEALRRAASRAESVTLPAVPALWRAWHDAGAIPANVRLAISAGAVLPLPLEKNIFEKCGLKVHNFFGSSECGGIIYDNSEIPREEAACAGAALHDVQVSVAVDGCLEVRGPAVGQTYWPEPVSNLNNGVFRSSDLIEIIDGLVYFRGRACDRINVAGRKVSPETIEKALASHPQVRECLAFGIPSPDQGRGESIVACLATDKVVSSDVLKQFLMRELPAWQVPREWWFVDSLEANGRGKISRSEWRKKYLESKTSTTA